MWDHTPNADEILQARIQEGWAPTPSSLQDGDRVVGHAACLAGRVTAEGTNKESKT